MAEYRRFAIAVGLLLMLPMSASAAFFETHRFDIDANAGTESFPGGATEPGWTSVNRLTAATLVTAGFVQDDFHPAFGGAVYRPPGIHQPAPPGQPPVNVYTEVLIGAGQGTGSSEPTVRFRDITPVGARKVTITVYRSDPADNYQGLFDSRLSRNGDPFTVFDPGENNVQFYHTPIVYTTFLDERQVLGTLDLAFFDYGFGGFGSQVRLNGFEFVYEIPEPATAGLLVAGLCGGAAAALTG